MNVPSTTQIKSGVGASRKLALAGIVLFLVGFILGGVGNQVSGALPVIPFADTLTALGFVLALFAASRWKRSPRNSGSGDCLRDWHVLRWRAPSTHIGSGLGFGLEHLTGDGPAAQRLAAQVRLASQTDVPALLRPETGSNAKMGLLIWTSFSVFVQL